MAWLIALVAAAGFTGYILGGVEGGLLAAAIAYFGVKTSESLYHSVT